MNNSLASNEVRMSYEDRFVDLTECMVDIANATSMKVSDLDRLKDDLFKIPEKRWRFFSNSEYKSKKERFDVQKMLLNIEAGKIARKRYGNDTITSDIPAYYALFSYCVRPPKTDGLRGVLIDFGDETSPRVEVKLESHDIGSSEFLKRLESIGPEFRIDHLLPEEKVFTRPEKIFNSKGVLSNKPGSQVYFQTRVEIPMDEKWSMFKTEVMYYIKANREKVNLPKEEMEWLREKVSLVSN